MSDDIVERLKSPEVFIDHGGMFSPVAHVAADEILRLREEAKIFREGFDGLTRGNQELQRQILSQYAVIDEMITTKGKLLKALQSIAIIEDEKKARAIAFEVLDDLYGVD